ncbi:Putative toxin subunit [Pseudomonas chlororaphis]|uniref:Toxin subunit n=1 Tax=Pseudomonas chlororaphis TaxID=587753 RepID=A0A3G7TMK4_9PSED|nr:SpvB/TcaC N-terminal domain-containing protein [Pseudomonas chlororaphis]AZE48344.1 Putative toxin subunit [Pseudomonas chlororaphis]
MNNERQENNVNIASLSLPKGSGTIQGMGESLGAVGTTGTAELVLPLPISQARYAPELSLHYSTSNGNGVFGLGWQLSQLSIRRRTGCGTPKYDDSDEFLGPDGELLIAERDSDDKPVVDVRSNYGGKELGKSFNVVRYASRVEGAFSKIEYWLSRQPNKEESFWLIHDSQGHVHCLGKTAQARLAVTVDSNTKIAEWFVEESLSPVGDHIIYRYRPEDKVNALSSLVEYAHRDVFGLYLAAVYFGNKVASDQLYLWASDNDHYDEQAWLFILILDYGERNKDGATAQAFSKVEHNWTLRQDCFSRYDYGFEQRIRRLCRKVMMFHNFPELGSSPMLVKELVLEYDETPWATQLRALQQVAYESDGVSSTLPPVELFYHPGMPTLMKQSPQPGDWIPLQALTGLNDGMRYQLVDLYGEGLPGILFKERSNWYYRPPVRDSSQTDAVQYGSPQLLPQVPAMNANMTLMDMTGNGHLDWVSTRPGMAGYFTLNADGRWSHFIPFSAWPQEFLHPDCQLADIVGAGLSDLVLIGHKNVRFYPNRRDGFSPAQEFDLPESISLPVFGANENELVAFGDLLGSGRAQLIRVRHDGVTSWPHLGYGRFAPPIQIPGFSIDAGFNPGALYFADLEGSGASDLVYAESDCLKVYLNQSGNQFVGPWTVPLPDGVSFDNQCQLSCVDLHGSGMTTLVLTSLHMQPRHWYYDLTALKPRLLSAVNNNMGKNLDVLYRSSAQEWLDEKVENPHAVSRLPFAMQVISAVITLDEITGNRLSQRYRYRRGVYDGVEREFCGFCLVETQDTDHHARAVGGHHSHSAPIRTCVWYHSGQEADDHIAENTKWRGDTSAFSLLPTRLTRWDDAAQQDAPWVPGTEARRMMFRGLKGKVLRQEVYGMDDSSLADVPYSVSSNRYQIRQVRSSREGEEDVVLPLLIETLHYNYERIATDPTISHTLLIRSDIYGASLLNVQAFYPRRPSGGHAYPDTLPASSVASSYDEQQQVFSLVEQRQQPLHITQHKDQWRLSLPELQRTDILEYTADQVPENGLSLEVLLDPAGLLGSDKPRIYGGQLRIYYDATLPAIAGLVSHQERAELDEGCLEAYRDVLSADELAEKLDKAGYTSCQRLLPINEQDRAKTVWCVKQGFITYNKANGFYLPQTQRSSLLTGVSRIKYDTWYCGVIENTDPDGNISRVEYNYQFLQPWRLTDINDNYHEVLVNALGQVIASSFYGTEQGKALGFDSVTKLPMPLKTQSVAAALQIKDALHKGQAQTVAVRQVTNPFSWMGQLQREQLAPVGEVSIVWNRLLQWGFITAQGHWRAAAWRWAGNPTSNTEVPVQLATLLERCYREPVHIATLIADRYPDDPQQQIRMTVSFNDGFGRMLQSVQRHEPGLAYVRTDQGTLQIDEKTRRGLEQAAAPRWVVSGRIEYDNKGQPVREYQPFFVNDWRYIKDDGLRDIGYADLHYYDAAGRERSVTTAAGYQRRQGYYPWFVVTEDENDTLAISEQ